MGEKRVATSRGIAFVVQETGNDIWHGYPEAWDKIDHEIKKRWLDQGIIQKRDLKGSATRDQVRDQFGGSL
jgi:hypothetical protein